MKYLANGFTDVPVRHGNAAVVTTQTARFKSLRFDLGSIESLPFPSTDTDSGDVFCIFVVVSRYVAFFLTSIESDRTSLFF